MSGKYDDIINLPHHVSEKRPHMSLYDRAAQFSPFAALTGFDLAIEETNRLTEERIELDEEAKEILDSKMRDIGNMISINRKVYVEITYFEEDLFKNGGKYNKAFGRIKSIDSLEKKIIFDNDDEFLVKDIIDIELSDKNE